MSSTALDNLLIRLRTLGAPAELWHLANQCGSLAAPTAQGGVLILARSALLALAQGLSEPLEEPEWQQVQRLAAVLADLVENGATEEKLASLARLWTAYESFPALN